MSFCVNLFMTVYYRLENDHRDALDAAHLSDDQLSFERERGDLAVFWRYTV